MFKFLCCFRKYVVRDLILVPFTRDEILPTITQTRAELEFAQRDLQDGLKDGVYEDVS